MFDKCYLRKDDVERKIDECSILESRYDNMDREFIFGYRVAMTNINELIKSMDALPGDACYHESIQKYIDGKANDAHRDMIMMNMER